MAKHKIIAKYWDEIMKDFNVSSNPEFFEVMNTISGILKKSNDNYVYSCNVKFGDKIVQNGHIPLNDFAFIKDNRFDLGLDDFKKDLNYSSDPLGFVYRNILQIIFTNKSKGFNKYNSLIYNVPLDIIETGDIFGVFGTLDYLLQIPLNKQNYKGWSAVAGDTTFQILFPFHCKEHKSILNSELRNILIKDKSPGFNVDDFNIKFINSYFGEYFTEVIYFPKHYFDVNENLRDKLQTILLKKGWGQVKKLRDSYFEDSIIFNSIALDDALNHDKQFLSYIYEYIINAAHGKAKLYIPLKERNSIEYLAIENFKKQNKDYFEVWNKAFEPCILKYGYLQSKDDFGILPLLHLPINMNYYFKDLSGFMEDIKDISNGLKDTRLKTYKDINSYLNIDIEYYAAKGGSKRVNFDKLKNLIKLYLAPSFDINSEKIGFLKEINPKYLLIKSSIK